VAALFRRYLARLYASAESAADLPLVHGLALMVDVDAGVLAALWDVPAAEVPGTLDRLRARYDFVLGGSRPLHQDVATAVLGYLRGLVERESVRAMNERAAAVLRARLPNRPPVVETRVADEDWQRDLLGLLWHTFWADVRAGHRLLCHVFAPVAVLDAAFALELAQLARYFEQLYASADRGVLRELSLLATRPFRTEGLTGTLPTVLPALTEHVGEGVFPEEADRRRFMDMLSVMHGDLLGLTPARQLEVAESLLGQVAEDGSAARRNIEMLHRRLTGWIAAQYLTEGSSPVDRELALHAARRGVEISPGEAVTHAVLGMVLLAAGQPVDAEAALREAQRLEPHKNSAHRASLLGQALRMQGRHAEFMEVMRKAVAGLPEEESATARVDLGGVLLAQGLRTSTPAMIEEAVDTLRVAARVRPDDLVVLGLLVDALILSGEFGPAEITARQALAVHQQARLLNRLGMVLARLGRLPESVDVCREAVELEPGNSDAHAGLAAALGELGDVVGAERESREAIRLDPDNDLAHENLAVSLLEQGRQAEAAQSQRRAVEARARRSDSHAMEFVVHVDRHSGEDADWMQLKVTVDRIRHLIAVGADEEAIRELTELLDRDPAAEQLRTLLGCLLNNQQRFGEAEPVLRAAIAADPTDAGAHAALASTLHRLGHRAEALEMARAAARFGAEDREALALAAALLGEEGQHEEAIEYGLAATQLWPEAAFVKVDLALSLRTLGRFQEAERLLCDAVAANEQDADTHADLGEVQLFLGRYDAAVRSLRRAADLGHAGQTAKVHTLLGVLLQSTAPDLGRTHFELALAATRHSFSAFAHIEMKALADTALGFPHAASVLAAMREHRLPTDTFRKPIYDLLGRSAPPGLNAMIQVWREIIAEDPTAAGPFTLSPPK